MSHQPAFAPGQIDELFENILNEYELKYNIHVYSMSPWIISFDNFMTDTETKALISVSQNDTHISIHSINYCILENIYMGAIH